MTRISAFWKMALLCALCSGCGLPRDGEATTESVRGRLLRVGVIQSDPQAAKLLESLAGQLGAKVEEVHAPTHVLMAGLKTFELDAVYGHLEMDSPLLDGVGRSRPYQEMIYEVAGKPQAPTSGQLSSDGVQAADSQAALHASHLGLKLDADSPWRFLTPEQEPPEGFRSRPEGDPVKLVLALPPGENRWIMTVDQAILANKGSASE